MKHFNILALILMFAGITACVDEYNVVPDAYVDPMLVVEGSIISNQACRFTLRHSVSLTESSVMAQAGVNDATLTVVGSDGTSYPSMSMGQGVYYINVGALNPNAEYWLEILSSSYGSYKSEPMQPLDAPDIEKLGFSCPPDSQIVNITLATGDPGRRMFFMWDYHECYEVYTPLSCFWHYDPEKDELYFESIIYNHGWVEKLVHDPVVANNDDFDHGAIKLTGLYTIKTNDVRFQTRYRTQVYQYAITEEEYEYRNLLATQTSEMGGLFTPMPTELPSNIHGLAGQKCIGFIGVRGHVGTLHTYIKRKEVKGNYTRNYQICADEDVLSNIAMYRQGYRPCEYDPYTGISSLRWASRWVTDCTDPSWGAFLDKPSYWEYEEN